MPIRKANLQVSARPLARIMYLELPQRRDKGIVLRRSSIALNCRLTPV